MLPTQLHSYLLWRSALEPSGKALAKHRLTAAISLLPAAMTGTFVFGWRAPLTMVAAAVSALVTDVLLRRFWSKHTAPASDNLWLLTGLLLALMLPPQIHIVWPILFAALSMLLGKHLLAVDETPYLQPAAVGLLLIHLAGMTIGLGGQNLGGNPVNPVGNWPVLARSVDATPDAFRSGRVGDVLTEFFGGDITQSISREQYETAMRSSGDLPRIPGTDMPYPAIHGPRPLDVASASGPAFAATANRTSALQMLFHVPGTIGASSGLALIFGIMLLILARSVPIWLPLSAFLTFFGGLQLASWAWPVSFPASSIPIHMLSGTTLLAFVYFAADPLTAPRSLLGKILAGIALGLLELLLRVSGFTEGLFISIAAIQSLSFVIDQKVAPPVEEPSPVSIGITSSSLGRL